MEADAIGRTLTKRGGQSTSGVAAVMSLAVALFFSACGGGGTRTADQKVTLIFGAYTTPREAYGKAILPAFQKFWKDKTKDG